MTKENEFYQKRRKSLEKRFSMLPSEKSEERSVNVSRREAELELIVE